jgi:sodium pump decarboxylase gamma subunit
MIFEGLKLMVVGMTTVMLFLCLMIYFINLVARLTRGVAARELEALQRERDLLAQNRKKAKESTAGNGDEDIAVIAAAIAAFEAERVIA